MHCFSLFYFGFTCEVEEIALRKLSRHVGKMLSATDSGAQIFIWLQQGVRVEAVTGESIGAIIQL